MSDVQEVLPLSRPSAPGHDPGCKRPILLPADIKVWAEFDGPGDCYRTKLSHRWGDGPMILWCMMNPSQADLRFTDMTVSKTGRISRRLGFGGQWIGNACAYRSTSPKGLLDVADPVGPRNHEAILEMAAQADMIVIAHGNLPGRLQHYADAMCAVLRGAGYTLHVLRLSPDGVPVHPLARGKAFVPETTVPVVWDPRPGR